VKLIVIMSDDSELSSVPSEHESENETYELPLLPPLQLRYNTSTPSLPDSTSVLFHKGLFSCTLLDNTPPKIQFQCLQLHCNYHPSQLLKNQTTSNLWIHLKSQHLAIYQQYHKSTMDSVHSSSPAIVAAAFFQPQRSAAKMQPMSSKY
jgi:hypothetical protein